MGQELTIQQMADLTGLSLHTLRYYERAGLIDPISRAANGHRRYAEADLAWIQFLNRLRATGMPIRQMQAFAALRRQGPGTVAGRRILLEEHQAAVQEQIDLLQQNLSAIATKIAYYRTMEDEDGQVQPGPREPQAD
jgi:DNA-binding transcriptional MerR regulator